MTSKTRRELEELIDFRVNQALSVALVDKVPKELPEGYNPIQYIRHGLFHVVEVPFNGVPVWCTLRCLSATQRMAHGNYSDIPTGAGGKKPEGRELFTQVIEMRNYQEAIIRDILVKPSYDEIARLVDMEDFVISRKRQELKELAATDTTGWTFEQKETLSRRCKELELFIGFILPEDTFGFLTKWARANDISDITKLTDKVLLDAAIMAERGKKTPHEFIHGVFTDSNASDIDTRAWYLFDINTKKRNELNKLMPRKPSHRSVSRKSVPHKSVRRK